MLILGSAAVTIENVAGIRHIGQAFASPVELFLPDDVGNLIAWARYPVATERERIDLDSGRRGSRDEATPGGANPLMESRRWRGEKLH